MSEETILTTSKKSPVNPITVCVIITIIIIASATIIYNQITELKPSQYSSNSLTNIDNKIATIEEQIFENKKLIQLLKKELAALKKPNEALLSPINSNINSHATKNSVSICMRENDSIISTVESFDVKTITSNISANIRANPGLDQEIIGNVSKGTSVCIKKADNTLKKGSHLWIKIYFPYEGWVAKSLLGD